MADATTDRMRALVGAMCERFADEIAAVFRIGDRHCEQFYARSLFSPEQINTTSREDCAFLYLLIRYFERKNVFEIGTNIGTSAVCMNEAARRNGGVLTTSDPVDYGAVPPWSGIRFIGQPANIALYMLKTEGRPVDFCFLDWLPDGETLGMLRQVLTPDAILAVHDYHDADPKGRQVVEALDGAGLGADRVWLFPGADPLFAPDGSRINNCTAVCVPGALL